MDVNGKMVLFLLPTRKRTENEKNPADYLVFIIVDNLHALYSDTLITSVPEIFWKLADVPLRLMNSALIFGFNSTSLQQWTVLLKAFLAFMV